MVDGIIRSLGLRIGGEHSLCLSSDFLYSVHIIECFETFVQLLISTKIFKISPLFTEKPSFYEFKRQSYSFPSFLACFFLVKRRVRYDSRASFGSRFDQGFGSFYARYYEVLNEEINIVVTGGATFSQLQCFDR